MKLQVFSEIGRLQQVMTHRPGPEVDCMPPALMEELLFDDILYGPVAREEHDIFTSVIKAFGATNVEFIDLLREALAVDTDRTRGLLQLVAEREQLAPELLERLAGMAPDDLALALVAGVPAAPEVMSSSHFFDLHPLPNLLMSRDPQVALGHGLIIASMKRGARAREALLSQFVFSVHPDWCDNPQYFNFDQDDHATHNARFGSLTLEGGDVLVLKEGVLAVGVSERTMERSIDLLADTLRELDMFRHLIMVRMPGSRSQMHLDTIFTRISEGECLVYPPMFDQGYAETLSVVTIDLKSANADPGRRQKSFFNACRAVGVDLEPIACGGPNDYIQQTREQWTDGANSFALAPGLIIMYTRNQATLEELDKHGYSAIRAEEFARNPQPVLDRVAAGGKQVITVPSSELSRARGGPRCMTMPLVRNS